MDSKATTTKADFSPAEGNEQACSEALPRARRNWLWIMLHLVLYPFFRLWVRTRAVHVDRLNPEQGGILLINHQSYLDPILVAVHIARPVAYLARDSLFRVPFLGFILRHCFVIAISRSAFRGSSVHTALERLEHGFLVALFPEGTRSSGPPNEFRRGFLSIARRTESPVYPVAVVGADQVMPKGAWIPRPKTVTVVYGQALTPEEQKQLNQIDDKAAVALIEARVGALYREGAEA